MRRFAAWEASCRLGTTVTPETNREDERFLSLQLIVGFILALACAIAFSLIANEVFEIPHIGSVDEAAEIAALDLNSPKLTSVMRFITFFGNGKTLILLSVATSLLILRTQTRRYLYSFIAIMAAGGLLSFLLKDVFHRARPDSFEPLVGYVGSSFPSGHAMGSALFFGSLAYLLITGCRFPVLRIAGVVLCILAVSLISLSRVYLGVHYLSDVAAGIVAGLAWIGISITITEVWLRQRR